MKLPIALELPTRIHWITAIETRSTHCVPTNYLSTLFSASQQNGREFKPPSPTYLRALRQQNPQTHPMMNPCPTRSRLEDNSPLTTPIGTLFTQPPHSTHIRRCKTYAKALEKHLPLRNCRPHGHEKSGKGVPRTPPHTAPVPTDTTTDSSKSRMRHAKLVQAVEDFAVKPVTPLHHCTMLRLRRKNEESTQEGREGGVCADVCVGGGGGDRQVRTFFRTFISVSLLSFIWARASAQHTDSHGCGQELGLEPTRFVVGGETNQREPPHGRSRGWRNWLVPVAKRRDCRL